jgi:histidinol-phosphate phosphatase family protein
MLENLELIPRAIEGLKVLARLPLDVIVVSNQSGIALGLFTQEHMSSFNEGIRYRVEAFGARIDAFYFCPHLEPRQRTPEMVPCECSKPSPGMLIEASKDFKIELQESFIIGDKTSDIAAGQTVGCDTILVMTGKAGREEGFLSVSPDHTVGDLLEAAWIVEDHVK